MKGKRRYQPSPKSNPIVISEKIEKLKKEIDTHKKILDAVLRNNSDNMNYLANFARHDMGNAIQSLSATIQMIADDISPDSLNALQTSVRNLEASLGNFGNLIHVDNGKPFLLPELMRAIEIFVRFSMSNDNIRFETHFDINSKTPVFQPYQSILQLLHNLVINARKALRNVDGPKRIVVDAEIEDNMCRIVVKDTGVGIPDENIGKIYDFGFTTTDGSGIGLFHAAYVCTKMGGSIHVARNTDGFSTLFTIKIPIDGNKKNTRD